MTAAAPSPREASGGAPGAMAAPIRATGGRRPPALAKLLGWAAPSDSLEPGTSSAGEPGVAEPERPDASSPRGAAAFAPATPLVRWAERLLPTIVRALGCSLRYEVHNLAALRVARERAPDGRVIYCCWHGSLLPVGYLCRGYGVRIMASRHRDGEISARVLERLGFRPIRGSTGRGGTLALLQALRSSGRGDLAITPDGPRGPREVFQAGAVFLAARSGLPLVPVGCDADRGWRLASWDRFLIPAPFARVRVVIGEPLFVPADAGGRGREELRARAEREVAAAAASAGFKPWRAPRDGSLGERGAG